MTWYRIYVCTNEECDMEGRFSEVALLAQNDQPINLEERFCVACDFPMESGMEVER